MKLGFGLLILAASLQAAGAEANYDPYALPPSKIYLDQCKREALLSHPGAIQEQRVLHRRDDFWVRYGIKAQDGQEWIVLGDLATGRIIREQKLLDAAVWRVFQSTLRDAL